MMAIRNDVWVLAQPEFRDEVEEELERVPQPRLHIVWVDLPRVLDPWQLTNGRIGIGLHYVAWQELAYRRARTLQAQIGFDFVHHVSLGTVSAPPRLWRLGIPFIWGPIGGGQTSPSSFLMYFHGERMRESLRNARLRLLPFSPAFRKAAQRSMLVLATNRETVAVLKQAGARDVHSALDGALPAEYVPQTPVTRKASSETTFLWAGTFVPRKGLPIAMEALAQTDASIRLVVAGTGRKRDEWEKLGKSLGIEKRIQFLGKLSWQEMRNCYCEADGFLFTSIRDSFGTVILEAMAHALPMVALDHQGVAAHVPDHAALKVPVTHPTETVARFAAAMQRLGSSPELRERLGRAGWEFAQSQVWERRVVAFENLMLSRI